MRRRGVCRRRVNDRSHLATLMQDYVPRLLNYLVRHNTKNNSHQCGLLIEQTGTPQQSFGRSQHDTKCHYLIELDSLRRRRSRWYHQQLMSGENEESLSRSVLTLHLGSNGCIVFTTDGTFTETGVASIYSGENRQWRICACICLDRSSLRRCLFARRSRLPTLGPDNLSSSVSMTAALISKGALSISRPPALARSDLLVSRWCS